MVSALASANKVVQLGAGGAHSGAVTADGTLYTFGCGKNGKLGHTAAVNAPAEWLPRPVEGVKQALQVACGAGTTQHGLFSKKMALVTSDCGTIPSPSIKWP